MPEPILLAKYAVHLTEATHKFRCPPDWGRSAMQPPAGRNPDKLDTWRFVVAISNSAAERFAQLALPESFPVEIRNLKSE